MAASPAAGGEIINDEKAHQTSGSSVSTTTLGSASLRNLDAAAAPGSHKGTPSEIDRHSNAGTRSDHTAGDAGTSAGRQAASTGEDPAPTPGQGAGGAGSSPQHTRTALQTTLIVISFCLGVFLAALDATIVTVAVPSISADFNSTAGYTWVGSAYLLANAAAAPCWGKISDIWGRKPVLLTAVGVFWIGSLLSGVSVNMGMLIVGRAVQGVGGGGILILVNICISDLFSMRRKGQFLGINGLVWALAGGFGPVLGGVFTQRASWRWCFYINLPISGCAMVVLFFTLHLHNPRTGVKEGLAAIDWLGSLTIVGGTLMILLGLELGGVTFPWDSATVICLIVFGVVLIGIFFLVELRVAKYPVIPLHIFKQPSNLAVLGLNACHGFVFISVSYYLPLYFQGVLGADPLLSGVYALPFTFVMGAAAAATGFIIKKTGKYVPYIIFGFVFMTLGYGLFLNLDLYENWAKIVIYQIILGLGVGPNFQSPLIALQATVKPNDIASATATYGFIRQVSTSMSVVIGGVIFQNKMQKQYPALLNQLGPDVAGLLSGTNAASSVEAVSRLPQPQRGIAQRAYFDAIRIMFIFYVAFAGLGLILTSFVGSRKLSKEHTEHKTGLQTLQPARGPVANEEKGVDGAGAGPALARGAGGEEAASGTLETQA
ncbi:major facilitator superfamily transporter [Colletotrichum navitas]|uniref:Efflux pump dotC n=1 Tax=Colletotrichum navitas TaxID=681940 RepID=A0AAD8PIA1_9PEZI|nr:major facilitator superfamily transporter [Colletotrichum navitas]KAK1561412.1 major facilitator superfamily transporter [Colletotrichum navitas]